MEGNPGWRKATTLPRAGRRDAGMIGLAASAPAGILNQPVALETR
jgi:hypothetical protein